MAADLIEPSAQKAKVAAFRKALLDELPDLAREYIDTARAEQTTAAYEKVMNTALKVIEGLQVDQQKNPYANLPVINFILGDGVVTTTVDAPGAIDVEAHEVDEVQPVQSPFGTSAAKAWQFPADPLDLLGTPESVTLAELDFDAEPLE